LFVPASRREHTKSLGNDDRIVHAGDRSQRFSEVFVRNRTNPHLLMYKLAVKLQRRRQSFIWDVSGLRLAPDRLVPPGSGGAGVDLQNLNKPPLAAILLNP
jgi:hypothetical protein